MCLLRHSSERNATAIFSSRSQSSQMNTWWDSTQQFPPHVGKRIGFYKTIRKLAKAANGTSAHTSTKTEVRAAESKCLLAFSLFSHLQTVVDWIWGDSTVLPFVGKQTTGGKEPEFLSNIFYVNVTHPACQVTIIKPSKLRLRWPNG